MELRITWLLFLLINLLEIQAQYCNDSDLRVSPLIKDQVPAFFEAFEESFRLLTDRLWCNHSLPCYRDLDYALKHAFSEEWAIKMFDSYGKLPSGLKSGNINSLGHYSQCIKIKHGDMIKGKYCRGKMLLEKLVTLTNFQNAVNVTESGFGLGLANVDDRGRVFNLGICIPHTCNSTHINDLFDGTPFGDHTAFRVSENDCSTDDGFSADKGDGFALFVLAMIIALAVAGTVYNYIVHCEFISSEGDLQAMLLPFSLMKNAQEFITPSAVENRIKCIYGIKVLSMFWIIFCHHYMTSLIFPVTNYDDVKDWVDSYESTFVLAGPLAVDTFLLCSGILVAFVTFGKVIRGGTIVLSKFYIHRMLRLMPPLALVVLLQATLYRHARDGPLWSVLGDTLVDNCVNNWWSTLMFIQNYKNPHAMCLGHTWYLAVDTQMYVIAPLLIYPLLLIVNRRFGKFLPLIISGSVFLITIISRVFVNEWPASIFSKLPGAESTQGELDEFYYATHIRGLIWVIGFAFGYYLAHNNTQRELRLYVRICTWLVVIVTMFLLIIVIKPLSEPDHQYAWYQDGLYNSFSRIIWALCWLWIIYSCFAKQAEPINWFLGLQTWEILERLVYGMYLLHLPIQFYTASVMKTVTYFSRYTYFIQFCGDTLLTMIMSYLLTIFVSFPLKNIEKFMESFTLNPVIKVPSDEIRELAPLNVVASPPNVVGNGHEIQTEAIVHAS